MTTTGICTSQDGNEALNFFANIYNGIDTNLFSPIEKKTGDYLLWVGRFDERKGAKTAIEVARKSGKTIYLIGPKNNIDNNQYYTSEIFPLIDGKEVIYLGELSKSELLKYYQNAKAVLVPITWEEPFGLVVAEAMASGTPVIAFDRGAMREIIIDRENGYLCKPDNMDEMIARVNEIFSLSEEEYVLLCAKAFNHIKENFSLDKMVSGYEEIYQKILEDEKNE